MTESEALRYQEDFFSQNPAIKEVIEMMERVPELTVYVKNTETGWIFFFQCWKGYGSDFLFSLGGRASLAHPSGLPSSFADGAFVVSDHGDPDVIRKL